MDTIFFLRSTFLQEPETNAHSWAALPPVSGAMDRGEVEFPGGPSGMEEDACFCRGMFLLGRTGSWAASTRCAPISHPAARFRNVCVVFSLSSEWVCACGLHCQTCVSLPPSPTARNICTHIKDTLEAALRHPRMVHGASSWGLANCQWPESNAVTGLGDARAISEMADL